MVRDHENFKNDYDFVVEHRQIITEEKEETRRQLHFAAAEQSVKRDIFNPYY